MPWNWDGRWEGLFPFECKDDIWYLIRLSQGKMRIEFIVIIFGSSSWCSSKCHQRRQIIYAKSSMHHTPWQRKWTRWSLCCIRFTRWFATQMSRFRCKQNNRKRTSTSWRSGKRRLIQTLNWISNDAMIYWVRGSKKQIQASGTRARYFCCHRAWTGRTCQWNTISIEHYSYCKWYIRIYISYRTCESCPRHECVYPLCQICIHINIR